MQPRLMNSAVAMAAVLAVSAGTAQAKVSAEEAARLGDSLTPYGAEAGGNADAGIAAWEPNVIQAPAGWKKGDRHVDLFADDEVLFTITADNYKDYSDQLSAGQKAMFREYPTYTMPVYKSRRHQRFPQVWAEATKTNATTTELIGTDDLRNATRGVAFPIPGNGAEVIWNHKTRYRGDAGTRYNVQLPVREDGSFTPVVLFEEIRFSYGNLGAPVKGDPDVLVYFLQHVKEPPRLAGQLLLVHETSNQVRTPRAAWLYNRGQRRVRRAPNVGYDNPGTGADGLRTNDQFDMFNGAMDRYDWKLVGKKDMFIPYNGYKFNSDKLTYKDVAQKGHPNQKHARYEKHRVWVVQSTLKAGERHLYKRRDFYVDEDSWAIALVDVYDNRDNLWRFQEAHTFMTWENEAVAVAAEALYDLEANRYLMMSLSNEDKPFENFTGAGPFDKGHFTPANLRKLGR